MILILISNSIPGTKYQPLLAFSICKNAKKLFACQHMESSSDVDHCFDGLRAISIIWIVFNHTFRNYVSLPIRNRTTFQRVNYTFADTFFGLNYVHLMIFFTVYGVMFQCVF